MNGDTTALAVAPQMHVLSAIDVQQQVNLIQQVMHQVMKVDEHYGIIPGTKKPSLYKAGAEKLCLTFRLDPQYAHVCEKDGEHRDYTVTCTLFHIPTGQRVASGMGLCSTREAKYAYRQGGRECPKCGKEAIRKSDTEWYCWRKLDGCGATFGLQDPAIVGQQVGRSPNPDVPDTYNTVLKMACKRALVAATLNATAASDLFTQDVEDLPEGMIHERPAPRQTANTVQPYQPPAQSGGGSKRDLWKVAADLCGGTKADDFYRLKDDLAALVSSAGYPVKGKDRDALDQIDKCPLGPGINLRCENTLAAEGKGGLVGAVHQFINWLAQDLGLDGEPRIAPVTGEVLPPTGFFDDEEVPV